MTEVEVGCVVLSDREMFQLEPDKLAHAIECKAMAQGLDVRDRRGQRRSQCQRCTIWFFGVLPNLAPGVETAQ